MSLSMLPSDCDCEKCSSMCHSPCCGTPEDMQRLIDVGYGDRLMLDEWPDGETMLKPALKGHEHKKAPWSTGSKKGCTFWQQGNCELHALGLKPIQGKLAHHSLCMEEYQQIADMITASWKPSTNPNAQAVIDEWKNTRRINNDACTD